MNNDILQNPYIFKPLGNTIRENNQFNTDWCEDCVGDTSTVLFPGGGGGSLLH